MSYKQLFDHLISVFESIPKSILIALMLVICYFTLVPNSNEEQYLALAKQFGNPSWIPNSFNLSEVPGTRILYQLFFGFVLKYLTLSSTVTIFRLLLIWLFAVPIAKIYEVLKIDNTGILIHLGVMFLAHQSLFAGSFIFVSVEPKCFSYVFVFWALYFHLKSQHALTLFCLVIATYLHILVGLWATLYIVANSFFVDKTLIQRFKVVLASYIVYAIAILPFIIYLMSAVKVTSDLEPSASWIYTYFRSPHHTALAPDISYFYQNHFYGILWSVIGFIVAVEFIRRTKNSVELKMARFTLFAIGGSLLLVSLAFIDEEGVLLKYYPYRIMTLATFTLFIIMTVSIKSLMLAAPRQMFFYTFLFSAAMLMELILPNLVLNVRHLTGFDGHYIAATEYIHKKSAQDDVILDFTEDVRTIRLTERNTFAAFKFIPADFDRVHDWYYRVLASRSMSSNPNLIPKFADEYRINFILTKESIDGVEHLNLVYQNSSYLVYEIKDIGFSTSRENIE